MQLSLQYRSAAQRAACATFLRGSDPAAWLREIGRWGVAPAQLMCYLVPESIHSLQPAGLFVVGAADATWATDCLEPYGVTADCLYLPVHANLWPAADPNELRRALLWPRQLFHPTIGLVGFAQTDALDLADLLDCVPPQDTDWAWARPGRLPRPALQQIRVVPPTVAEVMQALQESIGTAPLSQLTESQQPDGPGQKVLDTISRGLLKGAFAGLAGVGALVGGVGVLFGGTGPASPTGPGGAGSRSSDGSGGTGLFERLESWMARHLADLEKKRENEIERLLDLFGQDMEEALKYAIPLGGPYQNRGTAAPSFRLGLRSTLFDLSRLGGGGRVDVWNLDNYQDKLRAQYQEAANQEEKAGRFRKAAYIYAHLLGNYYQAAMVLERGQYFREAALLHKDHLKNIPAAAACLERGGLLLEAVELYVGLEQHEKAGDLYQQINQTTQAAAQYERCVERTLANLDHPEAARLLHDKLARPDRALTTLLQGWHSTKNAEICLQRYFNLLARHDEQALSSQVRPLFDHQTPPHKRTQFLQVLVAVNDAHPNAELQHACREVAYEIISAEASAGKLTQLPLLKKFLPDDRLVASDCGRYTTSQRASAKASATAPAAPLLQLDSSIVWSNAVCHRSQFLALGFRGPRLHLARGNWYGNVEYYTWPTPIEFSHQIRLVADASLSNQVLLYLPGYGAVETKHLPKNKYFNEALTVVCPDRLPPFTVGLAVLTGRNFLALAADGYTLTGHAFNDQGQATTSFEVCFNENRYEVYNEDRYEGPSPFLLNSCIQIMHRTKHFYAFDGTIIMKFPASDEMGAIYHTAKPIRKLVASSYTHEVLLAIATESGCLLWRPDGENQLNYDALWGKGLTPIDVQFVAANRLVVAEEQRAIIFSLDDGPTAGRQVSTQGPIVAILPTTNRHQFALIEKNGHISLHNL